MTETEADSPCSPKEESSAITLDTRLLSGNRGGVTNDKEDQPDQLPRAKTRKEQKKQMKPKATKDLKPKDTQS